MGCVAGKPFIPNEQISGQGKSVVQTAKKLKLNQIHLDGFYGHFKKMDMDDDNKIEIEEFLIVNDIQSKYFGELVFRIFDSDRNGSIDFEEYLIAMWNFCTLDKLALITFTFRLFDTDNSGILSREELQGILNIIHGYKQSDRLVVALKKFEGQRSVNLNQFIVYARELPGNAYYCFAFFLFFLFCLCLIV
jgi:Ca2+-binding EF-hand superfamily protein